MNKSLFVALISLALFGCSESVEDGPGWDLETVCGTGEAVVVDDGLLCVYRSEIIETGFLCPAEVEFRHDVGDAVVCSNAPELPQSGLDALAQDFGEWVFPFGAAPQHDPRRIWARPEIEVPGRAAGTCEIAELYTRGAQTWTFDDEGRPVSMEEGGMVQNAWTYDAAGWLQTAEYYGLTTSFERDGFHRVTRIVEQQNADTWTWELTYGDRNRLSSVEYTDADGETTVVDTSWSDDGRTWRNPFEYCGERIETFDAQGQVALTSYTGCEAFGEPLNEYVYGEYGLTEVWTLDRATDMRDYLRDEVVYDANGYPATVRRGGWLDQDEMTRASAKTGRTELEWTDGKVTRIQQFLDWNGRQIGDAGATGECVFSQRDLLSMFTIFGSVLPDE